VQIIWYVYILECADGTFYTGITNNLDKRIKAHNSGKGAKYTKGRGPVELVYQESKQNKSEALKSEFALKKLTREQKLKIIDRYKNGQETNDSE
jgi:putative endonuclease